MRRPSEAGSVSAISCRRGCRYSSIASTWSGRRRAPRCARARSAAARLQLGDAHRVLVRHPEREVARGSRRRAGRRVDRPAREARDAIEIERRVRQVLVVDQAAHAFAQQRCASAGNSARCARAGAHGGGGCAPVGCVAAALGASTLPSARRRRRRSSPAPRHIGSAVRLRALRRRERLQARLRRRRRRARSSPRTGARENGSTPVPASAPNSTALITLPACSAASAMSKRTKRFAAARACASSASLATRPSPSAVFSVDRVDAVGRGDQRRAVGRHQAALHRAAALHQLGGEDDVDVARQRHQRRAPARRRRARRRLGYSST